MENQDFKVLKSSSETDPKKLAGTVKHYLSKDSKCAVQAMGKESICITVKSLALLSSMFKFKYSCEMEYFNENLTDRKVSGILFVLTN